MSTLKAALESIAANVRKKRARLGWTQEELARASDKDLRTIQRIERGSMHMRLGILLDIADALEATPAQLLRPAKLSPAKPGRPPRSR